jgi:beta-glucosidase
MHAPDYLLAGLDMAMPNANGFWNGLLVESVRNGTVPESRVTDMSMRCVILQNPQPDSS